jgi:hypothetical protein
MRDERARIVAGGDEAEFGREIDRSAILGQDYAEHRRRLPDRLCQQGVIGCALARLLGQQRPAGGWRQPCDQPLRARAIRLREQDVDRHHGGTQAAETRDHLRHRGAGPWPLADAGKRVIIDIEDPDRRLRIPRNRIETLMQIEDEIAQLGSKSVLCQADENDGDDRRGHRQPVRPANNRPARHRARPAQPDFRQP